MINGGIKDPSVSPGLSLCVLASSNDNSDEEHDDDDDDVGDDDDVIVLGMPWWRGHALATDSARPLSQ